MAPPSRSVQKELFFKEAQFLNNPGATLQELIQHARAMHSDAHQREYEVSGNTVIWNNHTIRKPVDLGMLHSFEKGRSQLILATSAAVKEYQIMEAPPPESKKKGEKLEFNEGLLFFAIHNNRVIVMQSGSLRISRLTDYLNWLIRKTGKLAGPNKVDLLDPTPRDFRKVGAPPLKAIKITTPFQTERVESHQTTQKKGRVKKDDIRVDVCKSTWDPLKAFLESVGAKVPDDLHFDGHFKPSLVELNIELRWRGKKKDRDGTPVLDTILHAFQDVDNPPVEAITATGDTIEGNMLRTRKLVWVDTRGGIPLYTSVYERMQDYLAELVKSGDA